MYCVTKNCAVQMQWNRIGDMKHRQICDYTVRRHVLVCFALQVWPWGTERQVRWDSSGVANKWSVTVRNGESTVKKGGRREGHPNVPIVQPRRDDHLFTRGRAAHSVIQLDRTGPSRSRVGPDCCDRPRRRHLATE